MNEDTLKALGKLAHPWAERDAVHIAVVPVVAAEDMEPGTHVGFQRGIGVGPNAEKLIGVVDPYLRQRVRKKERFWLFLYPGSITSLRHEWTHPAFEPAEGRADPSSAERWLRAFAAEWNMDYAEMIWGATEGGGITADGMDIHSWSEIDDGGEEFWHNLEIVTGRKFNSQHREDTFFSCSC